MRSPSIAKLAEALSKAQGSMKGAVKDSTNPHFRSKYADLESVWGACRDALRENALSVAQLAAPATQAGHIAVETVLMHSSGEWLSGVLELPVTKYDPQGVGSAWTYARRYALAAIVGVAPVEDDDANTASSGSTAKTITDTDQVLSKPRPDYAFRKAMDAEKQRLGEEIYRALLDPYNSCLDMEGLSVEEKKAVVARLRSAVAKVAGIAVAPEPSQLPTDDDITF